MSHRTLLIASVAALLGLQGPLCALVCADDVGTVQLDSRSAREMPCHGANEPAPDGDSSSRDDCRCASSNQVALSKADLFSQGFAATLPSPIGIAHRLQVPAAIGSRAFDGASRIPPRDILLLQSTFLI